MAMGYKMTLKDLKNKNILILGAGKTGIASAKFLLEKKLSVYLSESKSLSDDIKNEIINLESRGLKTEFGKNSDEFLNKADLVIVSPGISPNAEIIKTLVSRKVPVISDIELASYFIDKPIIAVTGTNGKTTTTTLITHLINSTGKKAVSCGNIGRPICEVLLDSEEVDFYILELSSYQIYYSPTISAYVAIFMNFTPDHLDWHGGLENYFNAKKALFVQQKKNSFSIINYNDNAIKNLSIQGEKIYFSSACPSAEALHLNKYFAYLRGDTLRMKFGGADNSVISACDLKIFGLHNIENVLASISCLKALGINEDEIIEGLKSFSGVEHRIEFVSEYKGKRFYNDSKATNPEATIKAVEAFTHNEKIALVLGGRDKNTDLSLMIDKIKEKVGEVILFGEAKDRFKIELEKNNFYKIIEVKDISSAIIKSLSLDIDVVLFSPACASFDMFKNYEERGNIFKDIVKGLK